MDFDVAGIYHEPLEVGIVDELFEQGFPQTLVPPTAEPAVGVFPIAVVGGKIAPGSAGAQDPENGVEEAPIIAGDAAPLADLAGQMRFEKTPGVVREVVTVVDGFHVTPPSVIYSEEL